MESIVELIALIEKRPAMYLGKPYITSLRCFLDGWMHGVRDSIYDVDKIDGFQKWIEKKFRIKSSHSWNDIILFYSQGEEDALKNFFVHYKEWLTQ